MYPEINTLVGLLHERRISTFLVTNAQVHGHACVHAEWAGRGHVAYACPAPACLHMAAPEPALQLSSPRAALRS
jgi:hypothetical protein